MEPVDVSPRHRSTLPLRFSDASPSIFRRPPGRWFHGLLLGPFGLALHAASFPAGWESMWLWFASLPILAAAGVWALRVITYLVARSKRRAAGSAWRFLIAPAMGLLLVGLIATSVPLRVRWWQGRGDFERALASAPAASTDRTEWTNFDVPESLGTYTIIDADRVGEAVIFAEATGSGVLDDAGFAYLPSGPFQELDTGWFESPRFVALGGGWYAWTASW